MTYKIKIVTVRLAVLAIAASALLLGAILGPRVQAEELTSQQTQRIISNCQNIKTNLNQLHVNDALLRVNMGQFYESLAGKLMDKFNARLASNSIGNSQFTAITTNYRTTLNNFRTSYQAYEQQLAATINIDCSKRPAEFHESLKSARDKRSTVHDNVLKLKQYIIDYKTSVDTFASNYNQAVGSRD